MGLASQTLEKGLYQFIWPFLYVLHISRCPLEMPQVYKMSSITLLNNNFGVMKDFYPYCLPLQIMSDIGPLFTSTEFATFL